MKIQKPDIYAKRPDMDLPMIWFMECCIRDGLSPDVIGRSGGTFNHIVPMDVWEQCKRSCLLISRHLTIYAKGVVPGLKGSNRRLMVTRSAHYGTYNPELDFEELSDNRQYEQISALLNDMLATMGVYVVNSNSSYDDMLMVGLVYLQKNEVEPPLWLCFACQSFLDIHFALKIKSTRPFEELHHFGLYANKSLKAHQTFLKTNPMPRMRNREDEEAIDELLSEIVTWFLEDEMKKAGRE